MKIELTQALVRAMSVRNRPRWVFDGRGNPKLVWETVPDGGEAFAPYVVFDNHKHAAPGFGVKVSRHVSAYIVQRRVDAKTVRKATIEKTSAISLTAARLRAQSESEALKRDGQSIKATQKERQGRVPTLRAIIGAYQDELRSREKPAKDSSLKNIDSALRRLELWHWADLPLTQISTKMVLERFEQEKVKKRTSTEQTCRWAYTATKAAITEEVDRAVEGRRETAFTYNPFQILYTKKKFKTLAEWDADYVAKGLRNPLGDDDIGVVLDAIWKRRAVENNRTACDYLLLTLMSGTRRGELATLRWDEDGMAERTGANGKVTQVPVKLSAVDLSTPAKMKSGASIKNDDGSMAPMIWLRDTKNRTDHKLPLVGAALIIMKERRRMADEAAAELRKKGLPADPRAVWVFPARSSKCKSGHYTDSKAILAGIKEAAGISAENKAGRKHLRTHDFRRTLGSYADRLTDKSMVKRLLNHRNLKDATTRYDAIPWEDVSKVLLKCQVAMLKNSPVVYNSLLTPDLPPIPVK